MHLLRRTRRLLLILLLLPAMALAGGGNLKIITLQHQFPQDILPTIQSMVGEGGSASAVQNNLLIRTTPERMSQIEQVIATLDVPQSNLRITVSHDASLSSQTQRMGASGRIGNDDVQIDVAPAGGRVGGNRKNRGGNQVQLDFDQQQRDSRQQGSEFITVLEGQPAFIRVGQSVPFTSQWVQFTQRYRVVQSATQYRDITTGFAVRPRLIGNQVELEITPRIAQQNAAGNVDFQELATVVRVTRGQWLDLGGTMQSRDEVSRAILSQANSSQSGSNSLMIRVD